MSIEIADIRERLRLTGSGYTVEREIGRGGMASVFLARDGKHDRAVALKVLHPEVAAALGADRFLREIRLLARLQHPHILPLFDSGEATGVLFFVMPYVDGLSLQARLREERSLTLADTARLLRQVADALDYAHGLGIVHRDLKPDNVLLSRGQALLADFGIAQAAAESSPERSATALTAMGMVIGTPDYFSPEQALGEAVDRLSDVYSLGCVCYEMLAGRPPFAGPTAMSLIVQHVTEPPPPLVGAREVLPAALANIVARALAKNPADRFATAGDFAAAVEGVVGDSRSPSDAERRLTDIAEERAARPAVLVLDFTNVSGTVDADWLSTGIAQTVGADLRSIAGVRVLGQDVSVHRSIEQLRGGRVLDEQIALEIGRATGARWVVWGSFQRAGPRLRIVPQFADTVDGAVYGGHKLDGTMDDVFELQDRVVTSLTDLLQLRLSSGEIERIRRPQTDSISAYEHYARGYQAVLQFEKESVRIAADHFRAATELDAGYAPAFIGLGMIHGPMYIATGNPALLSAGVRYLEHGLALDPTLADGFAWVCYLCSREGRFDEALAAAQHGIEVDPASYFCWYMLGCAYAVQAAEMHEPGMLAHAVGPLVRTLTINPRYHASLVILTHLYSLRGEHGHATRLAELGTVQERQGSGLQFVGSLPQSAALALARGDVHGARALADEALARYEGADHVYAEAMTAYSRWLSGQVEEREGDLRGAADQYARSCDVAEQHSHRISIGAHWVKSRLGLARVSRRRGDEDAVARYLEEAVHVFETRDRFVWAYVVGASDAEVLYELASTLAALGREDDALASLKRAADAGWADLPWLHQDPSFAVVRDTDAVRTLCADAASRVVLPAPVGSGGLT